MAIELVMPRLGWTMEEGVLVEWVKKPGEQVEIGDIVFTVESDKALNEVESLDAGTLGIPPDSPAPGTTMPVGTVIGFLLEPGEEMPDLPGIAPAITTSQEPKEQAPPSAPPSSLAEASAAASVASNISPRAKRIATELGVDWTRLQGSGRTGRIIERDVRAAASLPQPQVKASPVARRLAEELGVDLARIAATKREGERVEKVDVEAAAAKRRPAVTTPVHSLESDRQIPMSPVRRITADRMSTSAHTTAPVTLHTEVDATELLRLRTQLKNDASSGESVVPSYNDLLAKASAQALTEYPQVNAQLLESGDIVERAAVHVGLAVDTERGLLVPVLTDAQSKTLLQLATESVELVAAATSGTLGPDALQGGTFTITNLGIFDIDGFTPIVNLPECAILGVGRIVPKQVVADLASERVEIRHMMVLSLTFDHRLVDGAPAARFLQRLKQLVEQPYLWLVS